MNINKYYQQKSNNKIATNLYHTDYRFIQTIQIRDYHTVNFKRVLNPYNKYVLYSHIFTIRLMLNLDLVPTEHLVGSKIILKVY